MPRRILSSNELAVEFHPTLNGASTLFSLDLPHDVVYHWLGKCEHEWQNTIKERLRGKNCVPCGIRKVISGLTDLQTIMPKLAARWHPTKNDGVLPKQVTPKSTFVAWWIGACGHEYPAMVHHQANGQGCSICAGKRVLAGFNDLASKNPCLAKQWHPTKNNGLLPTQVTAFSEQLVWWYRESCGHEWQSRICDRKDGLECSICLGFILLVGFNDLATKAPVLATEWHPTLNGDLLPTQITTGYTIPVWWLGPCGHAYPARVDYRYLSDTKCLVCSGKYVLVGETDLGTTHPPLALQWDYEDSDGLTPQDVTAGSNKEVGWICDAGHRWRAVIKSRTNKKQPRGCKDCIKKVSILETEFAEFVRSLGHKMYTSNRSLLRGQEVDIYLPEDKVAIEFNGVYWHSDANGKEPDYHQSKWSRLQSKGIRLLQVWEDDWLDRPVTVKQVIKDAVSVVTLPQNMRVVVTDANVTEKFFAAHSLRASATGDEHYALIAGDKTFAALRVERMENGAVGIADFAATGEPIVALGLFMTHFGRLGHVTVEIETDHFFDDDTVFEQNGFAKLGEVKPSFTHYHQKHRLSTVAYEALNYQGKPAPKIWDSGRTRWVKTLI